MQKMSWAFYMRWCVFAWNSGYHCLLYSVHFLLDVSIHSFFVWQFASAGFPLYYGIQTTMITTQTALLCCLMPIITPAKSYTVVHNLIKTNYTNQQRQPVFGKLPLLLSCVNGIPTTVFLQWCFQNSDWESACLRSLLLTMLNSMKIPGLIECIASDYADSHSRKWGHANRHQLMHMNMCVEIAKD